MEVFVCKTARHHTHGYITTWAPNVRKNPEKFPDMIICGFTTSDYEESLDHAEETSHWIESHEHGDENKPVMREMHSSDMGGVYVQDYR